MQYKKGMDSAAVRSSGQKLISYKGELDKIVSQIDGCVGKIKSNWGGSDADHFQSDWKGKRAQVTKCGEALEGMGKKATHNADEQEKTSK